jgi:hypothetical protein
MFDLDFDPDTHTYRAMNVVVPSVTQILAPMYDFKFVDPDVLQRAADFGTAVHKACELRDLKDLDEGSLHPALAPYLRAWERFLSEKRVNVLEVEKRYYDPSLGFAGTIDRLLEIDGAPVLADIKTVSKLHANVGIQLAAYERLINTNTTFKRIKRAAVQLCPDGSYRYRTYHDAFDWPAFASLLTLHNWRIKNAA